MRVVIAPDRASRAAVAGVAAYAALFTLGLPLLLVLWMRRLDALIPAPRVASVPAGTALALLGAAIIAAAVTALWRHGRGLPMSPFPPERLIASGVYALVADPVYLGSVLVCAGVAIALGSGAGLFIVSPVLALASAAFVLGYEREATRRRFGRTVRPLLTLPAEDDGRPSRWERVSVYVLVLAPWLLLFEAVEFLGVPHDAVSTYLPLEEPWPVIPWTEAVYALAYPLVLLAPLAAARRRHLRRFALGGLAATALIIPFYLLVPLVAPARPVPAESAWAWLLRLERIGDTAMTALPAFHVVWVCLAAEVGVARWPRLRWPAILLALAIGASCVTVGMHAVADVIAAFVAYGVIRSGARMWASTCRATEAVANSWRERTVGPVRFLSHGIYAGLGAALGVAAGVAVAGPGALWWMVAMTAAAEVGAALWAQLVEGSNQLLRPYGYFGSVIAVVAVAPVAWAFGADPWLLLAAMAVAGCVTQPFGRLRCLIQGCCHGRPVNAAWGIRYRHPRSRVLRLSALGGVPLHPTPALLDPVDTRRRPRPSAVLDARAPAALHCRQLPRPGRAGALRGGALQGRAADRLGGGPAALSVAGDRVSRRRRGADGGRRGAGPAASTRSRIGVARARRSRPDHLRRLRRRLPAVEPEVLATGVTGKR